MRSIKNKSGISPIISTVLLIMIVIILAIIILLWSRGFIEEAISKEIAGNKKDVKQFCSEISIKSIINDDGSFGFTNNGNVPIYKVNLKLEEKGTGTSSVDKLDRTLGGLVNPGFSTLLEQSEGVYYNYGTYEEVKILPVLLGKSKSGGITEFACPEVNGFVI